MTDVKSHAAIYGALRAATLARHFALRRFSRADLFSNLNVLGECPDCDVPAPGSAGPTKTRPCFQYPCVPRRPGAPVYVPPGAVEDGAPEGISEHERWRVWNHDHSNALGMTGMRLTHLCVDYRLGDKFAREVIQSALLALDALFKYRDDPDFCGYILRWDPAADDDWELSIDQRGRVRPVLAGRFLLDSRAKEYRPGGHKYLYCTPLKDPRYMEVNNRGGENWEQKDRFRRWEPSKDEYIVLLAGLTAVYDTFYQGSSPEDKGIVRQVKEQMTRIATYLQRSGYLLVRPCGGVTMRGPGEILPLLELAYNRVFQRILGNPFISEHGSYERAMWAAGLPKPPLDLGLPLAWLDMAGAALESLAAHFQGAGWPTLLTPGQLAQQLGDDHLAVLAWLCMHRSEIDVQNDSTRTEVPSGYFFSCLTRDQREQWFLGWLRGPGSGIWEGFKPHLAMMFLNDDGLPGADKGFAALVREAYLGWFAGAYAKARLDPVDPESPDPPQVHALPVTRLRDGEYDWGYATAVAMLLAYRQAQLALGERAADDPDYQLLVKSVGEQLQRMRCELLDEMNRHRDIGHAVPLTVFGKGCSVLNPLELPGHDGCPLHEGARLLLVTEYQDKVGNWCGYMPTLALAWRHLLELPAGRPNPFPPEAEITLPAVEEWPGKSDIVVPDDVIKEAYARPYRMALPLDDISRSVRSPLGDCDVPLFRDPPSRTKDDDIGSELEPIGEAVPFEKQGRLRRHVEALDWDYPPLGEPGDGATTWRKVPLIEAPERSLVEVPPNEHPDVIGNVCHASVTFKAAQLCFEWANGRPRLYWRRAHIKGLVHLMWQRY